MTSDTDQRRRDRQLALMVAMGELATVADPVSGEVHYLATAALQDMVEGRESETTKPERGRHAKASTGPSWRARSVPMLVALGIVGATTIPLVFEARRAIPVHVADDASSSSEIPSGGSVSAEAATLPVTQNSPVTNKTQQLQQTQKGTPTPTPTDTTGPSVKPQQTAGVPAWLGRLTQLIQGSTGKHRAATTGVTSVEPSPSVSLPVPVVDSSPVPALSGGVLTRANVHLFEFFPERHVSNRR